jgi:Cyclophilin type peptidyl-prolyl cis-trans isomerase/CLD
MKIPFLPVLLGVSILLSACATAPRTAGTSNVAVMEIRFPKEKKNRRVVIEIDEKSAPATASNFRDLVSRRYYNGMRFHRAFADKLVQTGDPKSRHGEVGRSGTGGPIRRAFPTAANFSSASIPCPSSTGNIPSLAA